MVNHQTRKYKNLQIRIIENLHIIILGLNLEIRTSRTIDTFTLTHCHFLLDRISTLALFGLSLSWSFWSFWNFQEGFNVIAGGTVEWRIDVLTLRALARTWSLARGAFVGGGAVLGSEGIFA